MNESVLIVVTAGALGLALAMGLVLALVLRHERRRSDARAAMLADLAAAAAADSPADAAFADEFTSETELDIVRDGSSDLFAAPPARSAWPRRLAIACGLAVAVAGVGTLVRGVTATRQPVAAERTAQPEAALLDLLSLKHTQEPGTLTITGLVQNPRTGTPLSKITATAMLFGADEAFIASGRTPLDLTTLRPGDESGFVLTVPLTAEAAGSVARYRIGFRGEDGRIIGHVDRRVSTAIARGPS
jgi:hypothetical protein